MADAGKIMVTCEGDYGPERMYDRLCLVNSDDGSYLSKKPVQGIKPTEGEFWQKFDIKMATDNEFSETSINPVQNRVITAKINEMDENIGANADNIATNAENIETISGEIETLNTDLGSLSSLTTEQKTSIVNAINELVSSKYTIKVLTGSEYDLNNVGNGIFLCDDGVLNMPPHTNGRWTTVISNNLTYLQATQIAICADGAILKRTMYGTWSAWERLVNVVKKTYTAQKTSNVGTITIVDSDMLSKGAELIKAIVDNGNYWCRIYQNGSDSYAIGVADYAMVNANEVTFNVTLTFLV